MLYLSNFQILKYYLLKIYNKTILVSELLLKMTVLKYIGLVPTNININFKIIPDIVKYYYKVYNQQITIVIEFVFNFIFN